MKKILFILMLTFITANISNSQVNQALTYFPLKVGNIWVYSCAAFSNPPSPGCSCILRKYRYQVTGTIVRNNKTYFLFQGTQTSFQCSYCYAPYLSDTLRIDSVTGNIFKYSFANGCSYSPYEVMFDSLNSKLNDTVRNYCGASQWRYRCTDTSNQVVLGVSRKTKYFSELQFESSYDRRFAQGIGLISAGSNPVFCYQNHSNLMGCVLDGVLYGDTSMLVGINQISSEIPESFSLSQNYPNPFNPVTTICFAIPLLRGVPEGRGVLLKVFDILGNEVVTLVNEQLSPGTYEVEWDATNYTSGVYYYTLTAGDYFETKKMVLLR